MVSPKQRHYPTPNRDREKGVRLHHIPRQGHARHIALPTEPELAKIPQKQCTDARLPQQQLLCRPHSGHEPEGVAWRRLRVSTSTQTTSISHARKNMTDGGAETATSREPGTHQRYAVVVKPSSHTETWLCERCLQAAKYETQKLLDILITDFGVKIENLITNFSGNRGYHVHVHSDDFKPLDQNSRREIVDYIMGTGLEAEYQGFSRRNSGARINIRRGWVAGKNRASHIRLLEHCV